ncbi:MAG: hypothetical protein KC417_07490, partial [Myxococcales bacterium]|nr:hypothetical protein [Myxococcales bacterium]
SLLTVSGGGGGGGAGGSIFLEAPSVRIAGAVGAPGGGPGTVGCAFNDQNCVSAESERGLATRPGGAHGAVHAGGCNGGNGSDRDGVAESRTGVESGCGGGGGAGFVRIRTSAGGLDLTGASFHPDDRNASENPGKLVQLRDDLELPK